MSRDHVHVTAERLDIAHYSSLVSDPAAGAISSFVGTTRNNFASKDVLYLEYEAYVPMALKVLQVKGQQSIILSYALRICWST